MEIKYKLLGVNDDKDFCSCCGKRGLKRVVWLENVESGEVSNYGVNCASNLQFSGDIKRAEKKFNENKYKIEYNLFCEVWAKVPAMSHEQRVFEAGKLLKETGFNFTLTEAKNDIKYYLGKI